MQRRLAQRAESDLRAYLKERDPALPSIAHFLAQYTILMFSEEIV